MKFTTIFLRREAAKRMAQAHKLDCEAAQSDCRFIIQSENEEEAIELAQNHMREVHGQDYTEDELRTDYLQIV